MECEICGKTTPDLSIIFLEGTKLKACTVCSSLGKEVEALQPRIEFRAPREASLKKLGSGLELLDNFYEKIRQAREQKDLTRQKLAKNFLKKNLF